MTEHPTCAVVRRGYEAFSRGDMATLSKILAGDATQHVPGTHPLAGDYKGRDAILRYYGRLAAETGGTYEIELLYLFADGRGHVVSLHRARAARGVRRLDGVGGIVFTVLEDRVIDLVECEQDQDVTDMFWAGCPASGPS